MALLRDATEHVFPAAALDVIPEPLSRSQITNEAQDCFSWLYSAPVGEWYKQKTWLLQSRLFTAVVFHVINEATRIVQEDGCFIGLSYLVRALRSLACSRVCALIRAVPCRLSGRHSSSSSSL